MTEVEKRDINRRVALVLGWSGLEDADACIAEMHLSPNNLSVWDLCEATASGWFGWSPGAKGPTIAGGVAYEGSDKEPLPDFGADPFASDLVRQEIERRGWSVMIHCEPGRYSANIAGHPKIGGYAESTESPHHALCLAFLAACESEEKEQGK